MMTADGMDSISSSSTLLPSITGPYGFTGTFRFIRKSTDTSFTLILLYSVYHFVRRPLGSGRLPKLTGR